MASFKWQDGEVFLKPATGRTRANYYYLKSQMGIYDMPSGMQRDEYENSLYLLARLDYIDGDIGIPIPDDNYKADDLKAFCDGLMDAREDLFLLWNATAVNYRVGGNDDALLPPDEVSDAKKKQTKTGVTSKE